MYVVPVLRLVEQILLHAQAAPAPDFVSLRIDRKTRYQRLFEDHLSDLFLVAMRQVGRSDNLFMLF